MSYGLYLSASGLLTNMHRQDVVANNLANVNTAGFKRQIAALQQRPAEVMEDRLPSVASRQLLNRLGGGVFAQPSPLVMDNGSPQQTGNDLDVALQGSGFFMVNAGGDGEQSLRLTRDGRFSLNQNGQLITTATGHPVLDDRDQPIILDRSQSAQIDVNGVIKQAGSEVARLGLVQVPDPYHLHPEGEGLYSASPQVMQQRRPAEDVQVQQGWIESSNVDAIKQMVQMIEASRAIEYNSNLIQQHDRMMDRAINTLGRVT